MSRNSLLVLVLIAGGAAVWLKGRPAPAGEPARPPVAPSAAPQQGLPSWPPQLGQPYPDLELVDHRGRTVRLSSFKGKVLLIEPVGMTCEACNSFSGGGKVGGFQGVSPQQGLGSIEDHLMSRAGVSLSDDRIVFIQILLYSMSMGAPTPQDAAAWARHFGLDSRPNVYVLAGTPALVGGASYNMIPGFQLVDKRFILRCDAAGEQPRQNIWTDLLPLVPTLLRENS